MGVSTLPATTIGQITQLGQTIATLQSAALTSAATVTTSTVYYAYLGAVAFIAPASGQILVTTGGTYTGSTGTWNSVVDGFYVGTSAPAVSTALVTTPAPASQTGYVALGNVGRLITGLTAGSLYYLVQYWQATSGATTAVGTLTPTYKEVLVA